MSPGERPSGTGALWAFTVCMAALTLVLWIDWASSPDRGLFTPASDFLMASDTDVAAGRPHGQ